MRKNASSTVIKNFIIILLLREAHIFNYNKMFKL